MPFKVNDKVINKHLLHYVPHGINSDVFKPLDNNEKIVKEKRKQLFGDKDYQFVLFYNSRNVQRKKTSNVILAYRAFCDNLSKEQAEKCVLVLHTERYQEAGTDLPAVVEALCPNYSVVFSEAKTTPEEMVAMYNIADVTILISSNEGFGLSIAESIMCGTPVIVNVTGGLQDQIGQTDDNGKQLEFDLGFGTNNTGKYKNHGVWVKPIWPAVRTIQGSIPTPYIFDDICTWEETSEAIMYWYLMEKTLREQCGLKGREWAMNEGGINSKNMCEQFIKSMDFTLTHFVPHQKFDLIPIQNYDGNKQPYNNIGMEMPKFDLDKIKNDIKIVIDKL